MREVPRLFLMLRVKHRQYIGSRNFQFSSTSSTVLPRPKRRIARPGSRVRGYIMRENKAETWRGFSTSSIGILSKRKSISASTVSILNGRQLCSWTHWQSPFQTRSTAAPRPGGSPWEWTRARHHLLVVHTFEWSTEERGRVRLISARKPTKTEIRDYEEQK